MDNHMQCNTLLSRFFVFGTIYLLLSACGGKQGFDRHSFNLPEEASFEVRERFRVSEPIEGSFFSYIRKIHILSDGNMVVQNYPDHQLYEFSRDGELLSVIGRKGRGPGEFMEIYISFLGANDSLHVFEFNYSRHQVFARAETGEWKYIRERIFKMMPQVGFRMQIPEDQLLIARDGSQYGVFRFHPSDIDTVDGQYNYVSPVNVNIEQSGEISRLRIASDLAHRRRAENSSITTLNNARFIKGYYNYLPESDEVILVRNTSNEVVSIDSDDNERVIGYLPYDRLPTNREAVRNSLGNLSSYWSGMENYVNDKILPHEPYYWNVTLHENQLWVHLEREDKDKPDWVITTLEGEVLEAFHIPTYIQQLSISGNRFYGVVPGEDGAQYFAGFELIRKHVE